MDNHNLIVGKIGEYIATYYLKNKGFAILSSNLRLKRGEIDVLATKQDISKDKDCYVFEVKTIISSKRTNSYTRNPFYEAENNLNRIKLLKLRRLSGSLRLFTGIGVIRICGITVRIVFDRLADLKKLDFRFAMTSSPSSVRIGAPEGLIGSQHLTGVRIYVRRYDDITCRF